MGTKRPYVLLGLLVAVGQHKGGLVGSMRLGRPWTEKHWCESVVEPEWPMAYQKYAKQSVESKGRVNSNLQDMRHKCVTYGGESKCHICEEVEDGTIQYQLQGVTWEQMAHNVPTVTDSPWAVGGAHRWDFGSASTTHVCVLLSGRQCLRPALDPDFFPPPPPSHPMPGTPANVGADFSQCTVRCWGHGLDGSLDLPQAHLEANYYTQGQDNTDSYRLADEDTSVPTDVWNYPKHRDAGAVTASEGDPTAYPYPASAYGSKAAAAPPLEFNPQGFVYTLAGDGSAGYADGAADTAKFRAPQDVAVDRERNVYVADTGNHCVRRVSPAGLVSTVAGACGEGASGKGYQDGAGPQARFSSPSGITTYYDWHSVGPGSPLYGQLTLFVADTNNHRIRRVDCVDPSGVDAHGSACVPFVTCWAGTCGNGTFSFTATHRAAPPQPGLADGHGSVARFDSPRGLEAAADGTVYVADTNNHLIRVVNATQFVFTLAGNVRAFQESGSGGGPLPGCPPPCVEGVPGDRDGNLTHAQFYYPADVTLGYTQFNDSYSDSRRRTGLHGGQETETYHAAGASASVSGGNWSILVADSQRIRRVAFPASYAQLFWGKQARFKDPESVESDAWGGGPVNGTTSLGHSKLHGIRSAGMVRTVAGQRSEGTKDGTGSEAGFSDPEGLAMDSSGRIFVADAGTCRLRRLSYASGVAQQVDCFTKATEIVRPSGCGSYDPPVDKRDLTVSPAFGNLYYNYGNRFDHSKVDGPEPRGRSVRDCVGSPPPDKLDKRFWATGLANGTNLVVDDGRTDVAEDTGDSSTIKVRCPLTCASELGLDPLAGTLSYGAPSTFPTSAPTAANLQGTGSYSDDSSVCLAALHSNALLRHEEGLVVVTLERGTGDRNASAARGSTRFGVASAALDLSDGSDPTGGSPRLFSVRPYEKSLVEVQSISGRPGALLQDTCGHADGQPPLEAEFNLPQGVSLFVNSTLTDREVLFVADTGNNRIRAVSAVCSQICENGGTCVGSDTCECLPGWSGYDCTLPVCSSSCPLNELCLAPDACGCAPGYGGAQCLEALCVQDCLHGGVCSAPDTCACAYGWWDANCSTPVCSQTCGNGGNCTGPDKCACPAEWTGVDCRQPVCGEPCLNGGSCVAPGTCLCPPQWQGPSCALPVCTQGLFLPDPSPYLGSSSTTKPSFYRAYSPCGHYRWCNATNGFDCAQGGRSSYAVEPLWGPSWRNITGRSTRPSRCMRIEIGEDVISHFQYVNSSLDNETQMYGFLSPGGRYAQEREYLDKVILSGYARYTPKHPFEWEGPDIMGGGGALHGGEGYPGGKDGGDQASEVDASDGGGLDGGFEPWTKPARARHTLPWYFLVDRQVAAVELRNFTRGVYVCANGGNCSAPDTCRCAPGWMGFDCRTPVCEQGFHVEVQERFVAGSLLQDEVANFEDFLEPALSGQRLSYQYLTEAASAHYGVSPNENIVGLHPMWEYSNPNYTKVWEYFVNKSHRVVETRLHGNERYLGPLGANPSTGRGQETFQGGYHCSVRSVTEWEEPGAPHGKGRILDHPNYYSRYMDSKVEDDGKVYTHWDSMEMPPVHAKTSPLVLKEPFWEGPNGGEGPNATEITYVYTNEGHRLGGIWRTFGTHRRGDSTPWGPFGNPGERVWEKGTCIVEFDRQCDKDSLSEGEGEGAARRAVDLQSGLEGVKVQDTDLSYRPRVWYTHEREWGHGRWREDDRGPCVDRVVRGCFNNGTCVAPNTCECAPGWTSFDCSVPVCAQTCHHHGNCTLPNTCTCEKGWEGHDCSVPQCAQECLNGGECVAPDTCQCVTYEMQWYNREKIPKPLFRKPNGDPMLTGFTGFDCSVPICSQHAEFVLNVAGQSLDRTSYSWSNAATQDLVAGYVEFGGHGHDAKLECDLVRCPQYDEMVTANIGESFEGGCGFDPLFGQLDSWGHASTGGCCVLNDQGRFNCRACLCDSKTNDNCASTLIEQGNNFTCDLYAQATNNDDFMHSAPELDLTIIRRGLNDTSQEACEDLYPYCQVYACDLTTPGGCETVPSTFFIEDDQDGSIKLRLCGPTDYQMTFDDEVVYRPSVVDYSRSANKRTKTAGSFLCGLTEWEQGDYKDDAELNGRASADLSGLGVQYGKDGPALKFPKGRHIRSNYNNVSLDPASGDFVYGETVAGEGIFVCHHEGSCVAPEECTCTDGYAGFDCSMPLCRHLRPYGFGLSWAFPTERPTENVGEVVGCSNSAQCRAKDDCACIQAPSVLYEAHPEHTLRGMTGWMGTDCSTPICSQGYYDPFCTDLSAAPGGEGCYRCSNGGNCTAPDVCVCAEGWTGFDCRTPVCEAVADSLTRWQLNTVDEEKIHIFESDPCAAFSPSGYELVDFEEAGTVEMSIAPRGECILPNECLCLCRRRYNPNKCHLKGGQGARGTTPFAYEGYCEGAWQDDLIGSRNVLEIFEKFGERDCYEGYEGNMNEMDRFHTCHLTILVPTTLEYISQLLIILSIALAVLGLAMYMYIRKRIRKRYLEAKIKRRQARRAVEDVEGNEEDAFKEKGAKKGKK